VREELPNLSGTPGVPRRVIVLGGTGFVGRHVAAAFADAGDEVLVVARGQASHSCPHRSIARDLETADPGSLAALLEEERPGVLVDTTGSSWGLTESQIVARCRRISDNLLGALRRCQSRPRLVHVGSMMEYGPLAANGARLPPLTVYGAAKAAASRAALAATASGHVEGVVLRLCNVIGPGLPGTSLLGTVVTTLLSHDGSDGRRPEVVLWPQRALRDYIDVRDAAAAVLAAAAKPVVGEAIDIGSGEAVTARRLVHLLLEVSGIDAEVIEREPNRPEWRATAGSIRVDPERARRLFGWSPRSPLADAVRSFWRDVAQPCPGSLAQDARELEHRAPPPRRDVRSA